MGHFYDTVRAEGRNKVEANQNAIADFLRENGQRYDVRETTKATFIERVPPYGVIYTKNGVEHHDYTQRDVKAPQDKWVEVWEFELHSHA